MISPLAARVKRLLGADWLLGALCRARRGPVVVLAYHDLGEESVPTSWLRVPQPAFAEQLAWLRRVGHFLEPDDLFRPKRHRRDRLNVLMTFDDGFINQHRLGLPLLQRHQAPALFFVSTWHVVTGEPFWFDRIAMAVAAAGRQRLDLGAVGLGTYDFTSPTAVRRWAELGRLLEDLKRGGRVQTRETIAYLEETFPGKASTCECRPLNVGEITKMRGSGCCHFGSHSHAHELLPTLGDGELRENLLQSRQILGEVVGGEVRQLAYPNGDADRRVRDFGREAGYDFGYLLRPGRLRPKEDVMALPRVAVGGFDDLTTVRFKINRALLPR